MLNSDVVNRIYNLDCIEGMARMSKKFGNNLFDVILTSPFYNSNKKAGKSRTLGNTNVRSGQYGYVRYDVHVDNMTDDEYCDFTVKLFNQFDNVLKENGSILYNLSYGSENAECMFRAINDIIVRTNFTIADCIIWKKKTAMPNSSSPNKLTRIVEFVFVICRKAELKTFHSNKQVTSVRTTGQSMYENIYNFVEAKNNDGSNHLNKATYSSELCEKLLNMYAKPNSVVLDPFMGTGTTGLSCKTLGHDYVGFEISKAQVEFATDRINGVSIDESLR